MNIGYALLGRPVHNKEFEAYVDTTHEWIVQRTGIHTRYFVETETTTSLALHAVQKLSLEEDIKKQIGSICVATMTPHQMMPSTAAYLQTQFDIRHSVAFDVNMACTGFVASIALSRPFLTDEQPYALCVGAETLSKTLDMKDRSTCVLFGDGAGALLVHRDEIIGTYLQTFGDHQDALTLCQNDAEKSANTLHMDGRRVFVFAVKSMKKLLEKACKTHGISREEIAYLVPHQANIRILDEFSKKTGFPKERMLSSVDVTGNTSGASIPLALGLNNGAHHVTKERPYVLFIGFGGGLSHGYALLKPQCSENEV